LYIHFTMQFMRSFPCGCLFSCFFLLVVSPWRVLVFPPPVLFLTHASPDFTMTVAVFYVAINPTPFSFLHGQLALFPFFPPSSLRPLTLPFSCFSIIRLPPVVLPHSFHFPPSTERTVVPSQSFSPSSIALLLVHHRCSFVYTHFSFPNTIDCSCLFSSLFDCRLPISFTPPVPGERVWPFTSDLLTSFLSAFCRCFSSPSRAWFCDVHVTLTPVASKSNHPLFLHLQSRTS